MWLVHGSLARHDAITRCYHTGEREQLYGMVDRLALALLWLPVRHCKLTAFCACLSTVMVSSCSAVAGCPIGVHGAWHYTLALHP